MKELYSSLINDQDFSTRWGPFFDCLRLQEQTTILENIFRHVERTYLSQDDGSGSEGNEIIGSLAALFSCIMNSRGPLELQVQSWLATGQGGFIQSIGLRRSLLVYYSNKEGKVL